VPDSFPTPDSAGSLTARLPRETRLFAGSSYPLPLCQAVLGRIPSPEEIRVRIAASDPADAGRYALDIALAAEMYEASCPDAAEAFVSDTALRGSVFSGGKWRAGWSFLLGSKAGELKEELERREFMVFESRRPTWPAYWLQMLARYAMIWGQVPPGEDHEMSHFLEDDLPGVLVVKGQVGELEALMALAMMKMGCPAVVPPGFPFSEGRQVIAEDEDDILEALVTLPNLRVKDVGGERVALPAWCNPAHAREPFDAARTLGGNGLSFLSLRAGRAEAPVAVVGSPGGSVGVLVEVDDDRLEPDVAEYLERAALELPAYLPGVRVASRQPFALALARGVELVPERLGEVVRAGLKWKFPRLGPVSVRIVFDEEELGRLAPQVEAASRRRADLIASLSEESLDRFVACIECQSFSHSHVCIVTPDRPPMCGRDPGQVKCAALFGATWHPYKRRALAGHELREVVPKGRCLDHQRGEYEGINEAAGRLTQGVIQRVFLHSLDGFPHSSCGCFHYLAFRIEGMGVGVMQRGFQGKAPDGETWDGLANRAGGKQADGVSGLSLGYLRSPQFLKGDGGLGDLVWTTSHTLEQIRDIIPEGQLPATEADVRSLEELREFLAPRGGR